MRHEWPLPSDDELQAHIEGYHRASFDERLERYRFIWREFGPPTDMLLAGGMPAALAIHELRLCYIEGYYLACILLAQIFIEQSLGGSYIISGEEDIAEEGFAKLINAALAGKVIESSLANRLHELRRIRNAYVHPKAGLDKRTLMGRMLEKYHLGKRYESEADFAKEDAEQAIQIVVDFMRNISRENEPPTQNESKAS